MAVPLHGQVAVSNSAQPLAATPVVSVAYMIKAPASNTNNVYLGASSVTTGTGHILEPGDVLNYTRNDQHGNPTLPLQVSDWYVVGTSPDVVSWVATPTTT